MDHFPRTRFCRTAGTGGHWPVALASVARQRRSGRAILRDGFLADYSTLRHFGDWAGADGFDALVAWLTLRLSVDSPCNHSHRCTAVSTVWKILSHLPAPGTAWREVLSAGRR